MTTYISSLIEPVFRHARQLSRSALDSEQSPDLSERSIDVRPDAATQRQVLTAAAIPAAVSVSARQNERNEALDRVLAGEGESEGEEVDVLSPMSISTPAEADLRRLDEERIRRTQQGAFGSSNGGISTGSDAAAPRSRGRTDPLPRRLFQRDVGLRRHISWQSQGLQNASSTPTSQFSTLSSSSGGFGFIDDPITSRSVPTGGSSQQSPMSIDPSSPGSPVYEGHGPALPEDDGMRMMRDRIQAVQGLSVSIEEKSRLMHAIMTENWMVGQHARPRGTSKEEILGHPRSPTTVGFQSRDAIATLQSRISATDGLQDLNSDLEVSLSKSLLNEPAEEELSITPEALQPTFWIPPLTDITNSHEDDAAHGSGDSQMIYGDEDMMDDRDDEASRAFGCIHYKRNVKLQCADCHRWYTCRFCHDAMESHTLVRRHTRNMLCMYCGTAQTAAKVCRKCLEETASYYCDICKLWDDDIRKRIYHCNACGICRIGEGLGKDFYHCPTCDVCISMSIKDTHRCIERSVDCDCPICGEYMFDSPTTVIFMRCGHGIHHSCYKMYLQRNYRCPICAKSVLNMDITFRSLDRAISAQPMPEEFRGTKAIIQCNDCRCKSSVPYHWLGLKCVECDSYNTAQLSIIGSDGSAGAAAAATALNTIHSDRDAIPSGSRPSVAGLPPTLRGRTDSGYHFTENRSRRPTSTGGIRDIRHSTSSGGFYPLVGSNRSVSAIGTDRQRVGWDEYMQITTESADNDNDDDENEDEDDELDFWGGDASPRSRPRPGTMGTMDIAEDESDASDSSDDLMANERNGYGDDDDDIDEDDIALFGHR